MVESDFIVLEDGTRLWFELRAGAEGKTPVVFVHGNAQNNTSGKRLLDFFHGLGHPVLAYDLPGHGRSEPYVDGHYSMGRFAETLGALLRECGVEKAVFAGHSMGGMIVLEYAAMHPGNVAALVLLGTSDVNPAEVNKETPVVDVVKGLIRQAYGVEDVSLQGKQYDFSQPGTTEEDVVTKGLPRTVPRALDRNFMAAGTFDVRESIKSLRVPVLIVRGEADPLMTDSMNRDMQKRISGSRFVAVPGQGHNFLVTAPAALISIIKENYDFLMGRG